MNTERRRHRRVVAPGTAERAEEIEAQGGLISPVESAESPEELPQEDARGEWMKAERPPHW
ncbi:hypothetical protein HGQ17_02705 [Nesterenkonia sp. MY13]|uniref:Uncharacterized protein n=1 Tax=Nesterenkonia sedimenti TaxID=1463632 RepID=A0A7X8THP8_9MICC|nr:hypothetical protein [Nesterenkonia sedimenti]NLS08928.1 hypothetical protein [Nesterenkonia sedimenti]